MGLISRTMIVSQPSANGGVSCPSAQLQTMACITKLCEDCSVPSYGPYHLGCLNNGACNDTIPFDGAFTCNCPTGYSGANCEIGLYIPLLRLSITSSSRNRRLFKLDLRAKPIWLFVWRSVCLRCPRRPLFYMSLHKH